MFTYRLTVLGRLQPQPPCWIVNQLDTVPSVYVERGYEWQEACGASSINHIIEEGYHMTYVGIDVAKDKHDCYIINSDGEILADVFTITNDQAGFNLFFQKLQSVAPDLGKVKVGLEATGHYSYNILEPAPHQSVSEINQSTPDENGSSGCAYHCSDVGFKRSPHVLHSHILPQ